MIVLVGKFSGAGGGRRKVREKTKANEHAAIRNVTETKRKVRRGERMKLTAEGDKVGKKSTHRRGGSSFARSAGSWKKASFARVSLPRFSHLHARSSFG